MHKQIFLTVAMVTRIFREEENAAIKLPYTETLTGNTMITLMETVITLLDGSI
jgi:hypothetical protein